MKRKSEKAFSLIELLIVLTMITILATLAIPKMDFSFAKNKLRTSTSQVTSSLYVARMKAVNEGDEYGIQFNENGVFNVIKDPLGSSEVIGAHYQLEEGVTFSEITFTDWLVVFNSMGQLDKSCLPSGEMTGRITLSSDLGDSSHVEVTYITGRIRETNQ